MAKAGNTDILITLEDEFRSLTPLAERFATELTRQIQELLDSASVSLGFPIQQRVKSWASLSEKLERKALSLKSVAELDDLVGLRLILQFRRDVSKVRELIEKSFKVVKSYDTGDNLGTDQFGYSSFHFVVELPDAWLTAPSLSRMKGWHAEIQVRTTAQHIWAAASHTLQYKREASVPAPVRRSIHRVSALLEMIDLEFERLLAERDSYRVEAIEALPEATFNVDLLEHILDDLLPRPNKNEDREPYADLLEDLDRMGITDRATLYRMIQQHLPAALIEDEKRVKAQQTNLRGEQEVPERLAAGVFFSHVGLVRICLDQEFGDAYRKYVRTRFRSKR